MKVEGREGGREGGEGIKEGIVVVETDVRGVRERKERRERRQAGGSEGGRDRNITIHHQMLLFFPHSLIRR